MCWSQRLKPICVELRNYQVVQDNRVWGESIEDELILEFIIKNLKEYILPTDP